MALDTECSDKIIAKQSRLPSQKGQPLETPKLEFKNNNILRVQLSERIVSNETSIERKRVLAKREKWHFVPSLRVY
jgi:hypothetical protein